MPFARNSDLPENVRSVLPKGAQSVWRATFNAAFDAGEDEEGSIRRAWGAVKNAGWEKGSDGEWIKKRREGVVAKLNRLTNMVIDEIGFVDDGMNPGAQILFFKRKGQPGTGCQFAKRAEFFKVDDDKRIVYGWASVIERAGVPVADFEGDVISEAEMEAGAHLYAKTARGSSEMHERLGIADLIASTPFTRDVQKALGIDLGLIGWMVGYEVTDDAVWSKVKSRELRMFSMHGTGDREPIEGPLVVTKRFRRRTNVEDEHDHGIGLPGPPVAAGKYLTAGSSGHDHFLKIERDLEPGEQWGGMTESAGDPVHQHIVDFMVPDVAQVDQPESQRVTDTIGKLIEGTPSAHQVSKAVRLFGRTCREHGPDYFSTDFPVIKSRVLRAWLRSHPGTSRADAPAILKHRRA